MSTYAVKLLQLTNFTDKTEISLWNFSNNLTNLYTVQIFNEKVTDFTQCLTL